MKLDSKVAYGSPPKPDFAAADCQISQQKQPLQSMERLQESSLADRGKPLLGKGNTGSMFDPHH